LIATRNWMSQRKAARDGALPVSTPLAAL